MSKIYTAVSARTKQRILPAIIRDVVGSRCSVQLSENGRLLVGLLYSGPAPKVGDIAKVDYTSGSPLVYTTPSQQDSSVIHKDELLDSIASEDQDSTLPPPSIEDGDEGEKNEIRIREETGGDLNDEGEEEGQVRVIITAYDTTDEFGTKANIMTFSPDGDLTFYVDGDDGTVHAFDGEFDGTLHAHAGEIGGFDITDDYLVHDTGVDATSMGLAPDDYPFYAGATYANRATAPFRVTTAGALTATGATITGSITSTSGAIGGWDIGANGLTSTLIGFYSAGYSEGAEFLLGHATLYASAKIGLKADGSGKLASGNFLWNVAGDVTMAGNFTSTATITGGTIQTSATANTGLKLNSTALAGYNGTVQTINVATDGSGWLGVTGTRALSWTTAGVVTIGGWTASASRLSNTHIFIDNTGEYISFGTTPPTSYGNNVGAWLGYSSGAKLSLYVDANNFFQYNGSVITWKGANASLDASGNFTATGGTIGGWTLSTTVLQKLTANVGIILDSSSTMIKVGDTAGTYIQIDGANQKIQSSNYSAGLIGSIWTTSTGNAEFNNVTLRGNLRVTAIQSSTVMATGGTNWIVPAVGVLRDDCTSVDSPTTFAINVKDPDGLTHAAAGTLWTVNDRIRLKEPLTGDLWASISSKTDNTTYWTLNVVKQSPSAGTNYTFRAGLAILDYGVSGSGFVSLSADAQMGASPNITLGTHAGSPWTTTTNLLRIGNLNGGYGYVSNTYGVGMGSYGVAGQPSLTVDTTNGIRIISNVTTIGQWDASGNIVVGQVAASQSNVQITSGGVNIRNNTTVLASWSSTGIITVGQVAASQNNILISSGVFSVRNNTTERIGMTAAGSLTINDSGGSAVFTFDAAVGAEFSKPLTIGTNGGIYQGTGTFASPTTGLKVYNSSGVGKLSTYNASLEQIRIDTDGYLKIAAGNIILNRLGVKTIMDGVLYEDNYVSGGVGPLYIRQMVKTYGESITNVQVSSQPTIPNSDFETTLLSTNWTTTDGTPLKSNAHANGGTYSLELGSGDGVQSAAYITISELAAFLDLWIYGPGDVSVLIQCYDASSVYLGEANGVVTNINNGDGSWKRYIVGGGILPGTTKYKIKLLCNSGTVYIDDLVGYHGNGYQEAVGGEGGVAFSGLADFSTHGILLPRSVLGWTPVITFTTPGNLNVVYTTQIGSWHQVSTKLYCLTFRIVTSTFTHTTASGSFRITGIPKAGQNTDANLFEGGAVSVRGYTKANFTQIYGYVAPGSTRIQLWASGSGQAAAQMTTADFPTGGTIDIAGTIFYSTD